MRRITRLEDVWIRADNQYFKDAGFINDDTYHRVLKWLDGREDSEAQATVASWMGKDAEWMCRVESAAIVHFWYFAPVIKIGSFLMRRILVSRANELRGANRS
jgi:hypothetical protein